MKLKIAEMLENFENEGEDHETQDADMQDNEG